MSINDPIKIKFNPKRGKWYISQGNETFYDKENILREWKNLGDACLWAMNNLNPNLFAKE